MGRATGVTVTSAAGAVSRTVGGRSATVSIRYTTGSRLRRPSADTRSTVNPVAPAGTGTSAEVSTVASPGRGTSCFTPTKRTVPPHGTLAVTVSPTELPASSDRSHGERSAGASPVYAGGVTRHRTPSTAGRSAVRTWYSADSSSPTANR